MLSKDAELRVRQDDSDIAKRKFGIANGQSLYTLDIFNFSFIKFCIKFTYADAGKDFSKEQGAE